MDLLLPNHHPAVKRDIKRKLARVKLAKYAKRPLCFLDAPADARNPPGRRKALKWRGRHKKWAKGKKLRIKDSEGALEKTSKSLSNMLGARELQAQMLHPLLY